MARHRRVRIALTIFVSLFIISLVALVALGALWWMSDISGHPSPPPPIGIPTAGDSSTDWYLIIVLVPAFTAVISAIATISTIILAWRSDRRDAREKELKIAQLERELEAAKEKPAELTPATPKKRIKKVR